MLPHEVMVAADAAGGQHHRLCAKFEGSDTLARRAFATRHRRGCQYLAPNARDRAICRHKFCHAVAEGKLQPPLGGVAHHQVGKGFDHTRTCPPGDVKPRHAIAVPPCPRAAPFGPADHGKPPHAKVMAPLPHAPASPVDEGLGAGTRVGVFGTVELRRAHPVTEGQLLAVPYAKAALFGRVDHEKPAERPVGLTAERLLPLLVDQQHPAAPQHRLMRGNHARQPGPDDDDILLGTAHLIPP